MLFFSPFQFPSWLTEEELTFMRAAQPDWAFTRPLWTKPARGKPAKDQVLWGSSEIYCMESEV